MTKSDKKCTWISDLEVKDLASSMRNEIDNFTLGLVITLIIK